MADSTFAADWVKMLAGLPDLHTTDTADTGSYSYKYASLPSILALIRPVLGKHGFAVTQDVTTIDNAPAVTTVFDHKSGEQRRYGPLIIGGGGNAQAVGSAITYARRYALVAALGLAPDSDDDGAAASQPVEHHDTPTTTAKLHLADLFPDTDKAELVTVWNDLLDQGGLAHDAELTTRQARSVMKAADLLARGSDDE